MSISAFHSDENETGALFVEVVLPLPLRKLFTYRLPSEYFELAMPGKRVFVPFGNRKVYTGIVVSVHSHAPSGYEAVNVISFLDDNPLLGPEQMKFWQWIASYYMCALGEVMAAALPAGLKLASETWVALQDDALYNEEELDEREVLILQALKGKEKVRISELETLLKSKTSFVKIIKSLYERQLLLMFEDVSETYRPKTSSRVKINPTLSEEALRQALDQLETKAKNQYRALLTLISSPGMDALRKDLSAKYGFQPAVFKSLADKGLVQIYSAETGRLGRPEKEKSTYTLSTAQNHALKEIKAHFSEGRNVLLHGAAASGKTFLYIELIREQLALGRSVLYLIPEIALTEQLIQRLELYFGPEMMLTHSRFSRNEKVEIWQKAAAGEVRLLLGSRSAMFMPLKNTGLIIIDEEHEQAYKQYDKAPRYHARDAALVLARMQGAHVLMGSATPSFESYYNALAGKYGLVELPEKYGKAVQALISIGDIKEETRKKEMSGIFTRELMQGLQALHAEHSQAILFQNRKGYVPMLECTVCGWVSKCVNCDIALTYYKYSNNLRCHYCGYHQPNIVQCRACGNNSMSIQGYGTERISEELENLIPELRIIRFDQDSTRQKHAFTKLLNSFEQGEADVMVGTQIAVKGLDYGNVGLTAVVNADHLLNFPDFRSHERTFQLLVQLAGRAGRQGKPGKMVIQTRQKEHPVLMAVLEGDYKRFYQDQIAEREQFHYPPFSKLIRLTLRHKSADVIQNAASQYAMGLKQQLGARVLGPETPFVSRIRNLYLRNILIKMDPEKDRQTPIKQFLISSFDHLMQEGQYKGLMLSADVDPY